MTRSSAPCDDDRLPRLRRGGESAQHLQTLMEHLRVCEECWSAWFAWRSLEAEGVAQPGDEEIARRAADGALRALRRETPRVWRPARVAAAVVLLTATVSSAGVYQYRRWAQRAAPPAAPQKIAAPAARQKPAVPVPADPAAAPAAITTVPARRPAEGAGFARPARPAASPVARLAPPPAVDVEPEPLAAPTAATVFADATELRRNGRAVEAMAAFRRLQTEFADTPEATVSLVSLAEMLAEASRPADALALFDAYLANAAAGPLVPEALVGKARALERLGRADEARSLRQEIGRRPAGALYAPGR